MFNLAGHDMVTDAGRATTCRREVKAPWLKTKVQKMKDLPKTSFTKTVSAIQTKKSNTFIA